MAVWQVNKGVNNLSTHSQEGVIEQSCHVSYSHRKCKSYTDELKEFSESRIIAHTQYLLLELVMKNTLHKSMCRIGVKTPNLEQG